MAPCQPGGVDNVRRRGAGVRRADVCIKAQAKILLGEGHIDSATGPLFRKDTGLLIRDMVAEDILDQSCRFLLRPIYCPSQPLLGFIVRPDWLREQEQKNDGRAQEQDQYPGDFPSL